MDDQIAYWQGKKPKKNMQEQLMLRLSRYFGERNSAVQITQDILEHLSYDERTSTLDILKFKTAVHRFINADELIIFYRNNYAACICAGYFLARTKPK